MTARALRRHARILAYVRGSLGRRWRKNASVVVVYLGLVPHALAAITAALSDELGGHPVLRRLAATEPEALTGLLAVDAVAWAFPGAVRPGAAAAQKPAPKS